MPIDSSKFFDSIRIKPNKLSAKQQAAAREASAMCEWPECKNKGPHRAPKGRENSKAFLKANPDMTAKIEAAIRQNSGLIAEQILAGSPERDAEGEEPAEE